MITHIVSTVLLLFICITGMFVPFEIDSEGQALVIDYGIPSFQLNGIIVGGYDDHEYRHYEVQKEYGDNIYYAGVALPSVITNIIWRISEYVFDTPMFRVNKYNNLPWESL